MKVLSVNIIDTVVNIEVKAGAYPISGYYFSSIEKTPDINGYDWIPSSNTSFKTVKFPGKYYLYVKDESGYISDATYVEVKSDFDVTFLHKGKKLLPVTLERQLKKEGSTTDKFNEELSKFNLRHNLRTRESVVVGAMAFIDKIQSWGYYLPYAGTNHALRKEGWGAYKYWGGGEKTFIACDPYVVWSYRNAGLNIYADRNIVHKYTDKIQYNKDGSSQEYLSYYSPDYKKEIRIYYFFVGITGSTNKLGDNIKKVEYGLPGDVLQNGYQSGHEMLVVDKYDDDNDGVSDGYIVLQSRNIGLCYEKRPYSEVILYDMSKVFDNTAGFSHILKFWQNYYIPTSDYPSYLR